MAAPILKFKLLTRDAQLPKYAHDDDAGFDLSTIESKMLKPRQRHLFRLGVASEVPKGWYVAIRDRSGLAANHGLHNLAGTIDAGYRGEWMIIVTNLGSKAYKIEKGERIGQGILLPITQARIREIKKLSDTKRGKGGFGSTGRK